METILYNDDIKIKYGKKEIEAFLNEAGKRITIRFTKLLSMKGIVSGSEFSKIINEELGISTDIEEEIQ